MGAWELCGVAPMLFRQKLSGFEGKEQASKRSLASKIKRRMKRSTCTVRNSYRVAGKFVKKTDMRKKILTFRDLLDLSPCVSSASVDELIVLTLKDIHRLYPSTKPNIPISDMEKASMRKILRYFCDVLKALGDLWTNNAEWLVKCKYDGCSKLSQEELERLAQSMLEDINKLARERMFDMMDEDDRMSDFSPSKKTFRRTYSESYSDGKTPLSCSPATPTSVLPDMINTLSKGTKLSYSPPILQLKVQTIEKLSPIDVKRLSFHMLSHAVAQDPNYQVQKSETIGKNHSEPKLNSEANVAGTDEASQDFGIDKDTMDIPVTPDGSARNARGIRTSNVNSKSRPASCTPKKVDIDMVQPQTSLPKLGSNVSEKEGPPSPEVELAPQGSTPPRPSPILSPDEEVSVSKPITPESETILSSPKVPLPTPPPLSPIANRSTAVGPPTSPPSPPVASTSTTPPPPPPPPPPSMISGKISPPLPPRASASFKLAPPPPPPPVTSGKPAPPPPPPMTSSKPAPPLPPPMISRKPAPTPPPPMISGKPAPPPPPHLMGAPNGVKIPPPPMAPGIRGAPPPPPGPGGAKNLHIRKNATKLKRSSQMGNLYRLLKGQVEGSTTETKSSRKGKISSPAGGKQGMADALAEMTKRSAYFQQIEEDVKIHEKSIRELKTSISSFQSSNMDELYNFHKHVESILEKLTDETQVLARFEDFPMKKLEAVRMAAALYSKLDGILKTLRNWQVESPVGQVLEKLENYFAKIKQELDALERTKDEESKKFKSHKITFDFNVLVRIKEQMVDVSSSCMELALKENRDAKAAESAEKTPQTERQKMGSAKILWKAFQFAYRVYTFAGGHDDRADQLTREIASEIQTDPIQ